MKSRAKSTRAARKATGRTRGSTRDADSGQRQRDRANLRGQRQVAAAQEIGPLSKCANRKRRNGCRRNFRRFLETYFPQVFYLAWSRDHLTMIAKIQRAVIDGGLFAFAMPRGSGKTSLVEAAVLWALLYGWRRSVVIIGADLALAVQSLDAIKTQIETNDLLLADFPEVVEPVRALEGAANRATGQRVDGHRTRIGWKSDEIVLPTVKRSIASAGIVKVVGITGRIRGMKFTRPDGVVIRPDLVLVDDPQTDESAKSPTQCSARESILAGAILGLAGATKKIAGFIPLTVIADGDLADRILNTDIHPEFQGERTRLLITFPTNRKLWDEYNEHRAKGLRAGKGLKVATRFYKKNRKRLDAGGKSSWPQRFNPDELSAIQHAMNLFFRNEATFYAEYQNEPGLATAGQVATLTATEIVKKTNGVERGVVPVWADHLVAFIDVQQDVLFWVVAGVKQDFTLGVVNYGTWPDQGRGNFRINDLRTTLRQAAKGTSIEGAILKGLETLSSRIIGQEFRREDGAVMKVSRLLVDANYQSDTVYTFCRKTPHANVVTPSHGRFVGAGSLPFAEWKKKPGELVGNNWRVPSIAGKRVVRHVLFDANAWKTFVESRFLTAYPESGSLTLFDATPVVHQGFADHIKAEYKVETTGRGRTLFEWKLRPEKPDNHFLDCLVGCCVAASIVGATAVGQVARPTRKARRRRPRVSYL